MNNSKLLNYYSTLKKLSQNIKKSINNKTRVQTLEKQREEVLNLINIIEKLLIKAENLSDAFYVQIIKLVDESKELNNRLILKIKLSKMPGSTTTPIFDIKTAAGLIQPYNGSPEGLESFIDSVKLLKELTPDTLEGVAVKFIKTRLQDKARLGLNTEVNTIQQLIDDVTIRCADTVTPEEILAKLKAIKRNQNIQTLCDEVDNLATKLKTIYVRKKIPEEVAQSMATKAGVDALINSVNQAETKLILKASKFTTVREAIQKVNENTSSNESSMILTYTHRRVYGNNNRGNNRPRYNNNSNASQHNSYNRPQQNQNHYRGNNRSRYQNRGGRQQNFNSNQQRGYRHNHSRGGGNGHPVYTVCSVPMPPPQQGYPPMPFGNTTPQTAAPRTQQQQNGNFLGQVYGSQMPPNLPQY